MVGYAGGNYGGGQQYVTTYQTKPLKPHEATGYGVPYQQAIIAVSFAVNVYVGGIS